MSSSTDPAGTAPLSAARPAFTRATVCSGLADTDYQRAGRGDTIVALVARDWRGADALFPALARDFRLIIPELDDPNADTGKRLPFGVWLSAFLDGLGLSHVTLLADERFGGPALGSAMIDPLRVARLVVVLDAAVSADADVSADATLCCSGTRLLVTSLGTDRDGAASEVARVLLGRRHDPG